MNAAEVLTCQWLVGLFARAGACVASDAYAGMLGGCKCRVEGPTEDLVGPSRSGQVHQWVFMREGYLGYITYEGFMGHGS